MTSPAYQPTKQLLVEIGRTTDDRLEGRARGVSTRSWFPFSGVLELLKVIGDLLDDDAITPSQPGTTEPPTKGTP
jgi:hypothetical protein